MSGTKICSKCKEEKLFKEFSKNKSKKDGLSDWCKRCVSIYKKEYYENNKEAIAKKNKEYHENNKEAIAEYKKEYRENNKEKIAEKDKKYRENNKEKIKESKKEYYENNKEKIKEYNSEYYKNNKEQIAAKSKEHRENNKEAIAERKKEYYEKNKEEILKKGKEYKKNKYESDPLFKLVSSLRTRIGIALKNNYKQGSAVRDLGCSVQFLKEYLEQKFQPNMNWDNHGEIWAIDHIIPLCAFNLTNRFQFLAACYYENLQPLYVEDNLQKGGNYKQEELENYLEYFKTKINKGE